MDFSQEVEEIRQDIANGPPLFPPPINDPNDITLRFKQKTCRRKKCITGYGLLKFFILNQTRARNNLVINKIARDLWVTTTRHNRMAYINLSNQINNIRLEKFGI
ncbi:hypothetical protein C1645_741721 [Glomus cerebriforme]|uniref:HMG box domain-containing protein n=1 Tax=Glomus cerebriforme TaxID=658196 RepID=A0A397SRF4_9GLOM|nr:hypothetical protein C1645_741721 [Glomus cerebriforme]